MPQTISFEINDETLESVERYLNSNATREVNEAGAAESKRIFPDVESFVEHHMASLLKSVVDQYPPASLVAKMKQIRELTNELAESSRPKIRRGGK